MSKKTMIGLFSKSNIIAKPWAEAGVECHLFDLGEGEKEDNIIHHTGDIRDQFSVLRDIIKNTEVVFVSAFPPCTDLAVSGAKHFDTKAKNDAFFWAKAMELVYMSRDIGELSGAPYFIENPKSMISSLWRSRDFGFNPCDFGGYLPCSHINQLFPEIYPSQDAYLKETWLWTGGGFVMPSICSIPPVSKDFPGFKMLGGKSERTKEMRSVTPEGFARAVFEANYVDKNYKVA
jgi:hypothetical protein